MVMFRRDIFLMIRGVDQTGRAFRAVDQRVEKMIRKTMEQYEVTRKVAKEMIASQIQAIQTLDSYNNAMYRLMFAGGAFIAFSGLMVYALGNILDASSKGELYMEAFGDAWDELSRAISESILKYWGPFFTDFIGWLNDLADNDTFKMIVGVLSVPAVLTLAFMGITLMAVGITGRFLNMLLGLFLPASTITSINVALGQIGLGLTLSIAIVYTLEWVFDYFLGVTPADMLEAFLRIMWKMIFEGKTFEEAYRTEWIEEHYPELAEEKTPPPTTKTTPPPPREFGGWDIGKERQLGTTGLPRNMWFFGHAGEMLFNPQLPITPPAQMRGLGGRGRVLHVEINQFVDRMGVDVSMDELADYTAEKLGDKLTELIG